MMNKKYYIMALALCFLLQSTSGFAFWVWTPETNKFVNPKYVVKDTPEEQLTYAKGFFEAVAYKETIKECKKLLKHYPRSRQAPQAQYYIGKSLYLEGDLFGAFKEYQKVIDKYPFSDLSAEIVRLQYEIGIEFLESFQNRKEKFMAVVLGNEFDVVEVFRAVIKNAPYGGLAAPAQYKIALYLQEKKLYQEARDEFEKVINDYPDGEWAKAAKYQIAVTDEKRSTAAQYDQKVTKVAVEEFKKFVEMNPDAELSKEARVKIQVLRDKEAENAYTIAQFYEKQKKYTAAKMYYQSVVDEYRDSTWAPKALAKIAEVSQKE